MNRTRRIVREIVFVAALALIVFSPGLVLIAQGPPAGLPDLVGMLKATRECSASTPHGR
jgi:hypothetical protein